MKCYPHLQLPQDVHREQGIMLERKREKLSLTTWIDEKLLSLTSGIQAIKQPYCMRSDPVCREDSNLSQWTKWVNQLWTTMDTTSTRISSTSFTNCRGRTFQILLHRNTRHVSSLLLEKLLFALEKEWTTSPSDGTISHEGVSEYTKQYLILRSFNNLLTWSFLFLWGCFVHY